MAVERSSYYITCAVLLGFSVAYVYSYWVKYGGNRILMSKFSLYLYMTLLLITCIICMLRYLIPRQKYRREANLTERQATHAHRTQLTIISAVAKCGVIIFLIGAVAFDCVSELGLLTCMDVFLSDHCFEKERMMNAINLITKMLFMGVQATFLMSENEMYLKYGRTNTGRNVYIVNSIANFTFVIFCALHEIRPNQNPNHKTTHVFCLSPFKLVNGSAEVEANYMHQYECINDNTSIDRVAKHMGMFLYPFHSEFCIMATTLNLILWKLCSGDMVKDGTISSRKCRRRRRRRTERIHPRGSITSSIVRETPSGSNDRTSFERRRLLEHEESDTEIETTLSIDSVPEMIIPVRDNQAVFTDIVQSTASRHDQVVGSEGYGSMDGANSAGSPREPATSESQEADGPFMCCPGQCRGCFDPRPQRSYGPDNGCGFFAFAGFTLLLLTTVMSLLLQSGSLRKKLFTPLYVLDTVQVLLMLIAAIFLAEICRRKLQIAPRVKQTLSVGSIVLIISAFIIFIFRVLEGIAAVDLLILKPNSTQMDKEFSEKHIFTLKTQNILDIFDALLYIAQVAIQTNLVLRIHWIMKRNLPDDVISSSTAMQCTSFLMVANFSLWLVGTVVELRYSEINYTQVLYYSDATWKSVVYMFYPFVVYYRFHCTISLAEYMLWRMEVKNAGRLGTRREDFVSAIGTFAYF